METRPTPDPTGHGGIRPRAQSRPGPVYLITTPVANPPAEKEATEQATSGKQRGRPQRGLQADPRR